MATLPPESTLNDPPPAANHRNPWRAAPLPSNFVHGTFKGEPAITVPRAIEASLAAKFDTTLLGKFSQGKPSLETIRKFFAVQNFKGTVFVGLIDQKHVLLRFALREDYIRLFSKSIWNVNGKPMRILKWTSNFRIDREPSIVSIWLSLPMLPIHLVNQEFIFSLVSTFSKPLRIDNATEHLNRPSVARVQVEIDLLDSLPSRVWIQSETGAGFWQAIELETTLPSYCRFCWHIGHEEHSCTVKYPELLHTFTHKYETHIHKEFRPKQKAKGNNVHTAQYGNTYSISDIDNGADLSLDINTSIKTVDKGKRVMAESSILEEGVSSKWSDEDMTNTDNKTSAALKDDNTKLPSNLTQAGLNLEASILKTDELYQKEGTEAAHEVKKVEGTKSDQAHTGLASSDQNNFENSGSKSLTTRMDDGSQKLDVAANLGPEAVPNTAGSATVKEGVLLAAPISSAAALGQSKKVSKELGQNVVIANQLAKAAQDSKVGKDSKGLTTKNSFEILSIPDPLDMEGVYSQESNCRNSIQDELKYMILDPKAQLGEGMSDEEFNDFKEMFTPAKRITRITRIRKKKQIFDI